MFYDLLVSKGGKPHFVKKYIKMIENFDCKETDYSELHHILPKHLFPEFAKDPNNLKRLSGRQHYIVHVCLALAFPKTKMVFAVIAMKRGGRRNDQGIHFNSHLYEKLKIQFAKKMSIISKNICRKGKNNSMYGRRGKNNPQFGYKRSKEQIIEITKGIMALHKRMAEDPAFKKKMLEQRRANTDIEQWKERSRLAKLGELNPNFRKDITNSLTEEQKELQKKNARVGMLEKMPWEKKSWTEDKDYFWSKADELYMCLKYQNMKPSNALMTVYNDKSVKTFNACASLLKRIKEGWNPSENQKWIERYRGVK